MKRPAWMTYDKRKVLRVMRKELRRKKRFTMIEYHYLAMRTSPRDGHDKIDNGILGLIGETGELVDVYKKWMYQSGPDAQLPARKFADELGDVLWYLAELADGMDMNIYDIAGEEFDELDAAVRRAGVKKAPVRQIVLSMSRCANRISSTIAKGSADRIGADMRRLISGAARLAWAIGYKLEDIARMNIEKLQQRYPDGFDPEISKGRYTE